MTLTVLRSIGQLLCKHINDFYCWCWLWLPSVQFSPSVVSSSLQPHGLQHARLPCPSPTLRAYSNSRPWSRWCHPTISSSVISFSFCLHSFPASGYFPVSQFSTSRGQIIGISASAPVLPMNFDLISFKIDWFDLLAVQGTLKTFLQHQSSQVKPLITSQRYHLSGFFTVVHHACLRVGKFYSRSSRVEFLHKLCRTLLCTEFCLLFYLFLFTKSLIPICGIHFYSVLGLKTNTTLMFSCCSNCSSIGRCMLLQLASVSWICFWYAVTNMHIFWHVLFSHSFWKPLVSLSKL